MGLIQIVTIKVWKHVYRFKLFKFVKKVCCILERICGNKCLKTFGVCECGDTTFETSDDKYCYIPKNDTCETQGIFCKAKQYCPLCQVVFNPFDTFR